MRNLRILRDHAPKLGQKLSSPVTAFAWDTNSDAIIYASGPSADSATIQLRKAPRIEEDCDDPTSFVAAWDAPSPLPDLAFDRIVNLHYLAETHVSCLVLAGGDVVNVFPDPDSRSKIEIVGSVDGGITAATWSPDDELLAITTRLNTILFMTADFDCLASVDLTEEDAKLSKHVSVGWGKSETQFKGKRAKAMRDPTMPEKTEQGTLSPFDRHEVTISWRGDGAFVAVNSIIQDGPRRMIRIFNRQGVLESVSEPVDGLEGALSWRPSGNLIAGVQRLQNEANVVFFERNGLRHGQFSLRLTPDNLERWSSHITLAWNPLSTILAVSYQDQVQLWTMGNYHYYLKQQIPIWGEAMTTAIPVTWHPEDSMRISMLCSDSGPSKPLADGDLQVPICHLRDMQLGHVVASGPNTSPYPSGLVAVIDGESLKYTPLEEANVPPPMSLHEVSTSCSKDVAVNDQNTLIAALHEDTVTLVKMDRAAGSSEPRLVEVKPITKPVTHNSLQICSWKGDFFVLSLDRVSRELRLYNIATERSFPVPGASFNSCHLASSVDTEALYLLESTSVFELNMSAAEDGETSGEALESRVICQFPTHATVSKLEVVRHEEVICFGLTSNGALYANTRQLLKNCTSFLITQEYLIVTTTNHLLKFIHLASVDDLEVPQDDDENDERCRSIERGARLVTVMPATFSLVLQMPRGNLETIYPRALVLASIRKNLDARKYRDAFLICRTQRVDMNILHDYSPSQFLENVELFVNQVKKIEHIDLFLSQLKDEDVSRTMYRETLIRHLKSDKAPSGSKLSNDPIKNEVNGAPTQPSDDAKVNRICDAFLSVLRSRYSTNLQNVITAHVCKNPPNIEEGLRVVAGLRAEQSELTDQAVEQICFLVDVNRVYESALGLYDLDLALLVAQQSQKDPREYLPYLQNLQSLPPMRARFTIDNDLNRWVKALAHLKDMEQFTEFKAYMQNHQLYTEALDLYRYDQEQTKALTHLYADYLNDRHRYKEAGIAYESLNDYASASSAYRAENLWEQCLSAASMIPLPENELRSLASSLAEQLSNTKDFQSSAIINLDYLYDLETALSHFCKAHRFATAIRIAALRGRPEFLTEIIDPGLVESSAALTELLADCKAQLKAQVPRLRELRQTKAANPLAFFGGDGDGNGHVDIPDDVSVAPSATSTAGGASLFTRYTQRSGLTNTVATGTSRKTSKNRRREERKRARGKKGSVYEEEYLVNSIGRLIERVNDTTSDVSSTAEGLLRRNMKELARAIEKAMEEVVAICAECVAEVFEVSPKDPQAPNGDTDEDATAEGRPPGADGVLWDSMEEAKAARVVPIVKPYKRSDMAY